ncbi:hypothetical protein B0H11DRAFT_2287500 [Mycena galericulata]|nr:hypothetical protein B0H11DRAFT_2287500 [Mycena galericulata]
MKQNLTLPLALLLGSSSMAAAATGLGRITAAFYKCPSCRVMPTSAQDVSSALVILTLGNCTFAVRSATCRGKGPTTLMLPGS